jgi:predicted Zn-dependent protease
VVDDGAGPFAYREITFDDEGADSQRSVLVDKGVGLLPARSSERCLI